MSLDASPAISSYAVPRYRAEGAAFYHVLHGTVPGHQIDFMYCPEVPQGALRQTHVGHLARLIKYIEPRETAAYAFALGNLSRDDVQHDPGHGGLAILFALRVPGVVDHAGRDTPPYAHAVIAVDRHLNYATLLEATTVLYRRFLEREGAEDRRGDFYRSYFRMMRESPADIPAFLARAIAEHDDLPSPRKSSLGWEYEADESESPRQIAIVHDEPIDFGTIAHWASTLGALLYRSNIKWTTVSTGREIDIAGGTSVRFVPRSEAQAVRGVMHELDALPEDDDELARLLFGAKRRATAAPAPRQGWREAMAAQRSARSEPPPAGGEASVDTEVDDAAATIPVASPLEGARGFDPRRSSPVGGQGAAQLPAAVPGDAPQGATTRAAVPASLVPGPLLEEGPFSGKHTRETTSKGRWIIAVAVLAALAVIAVVVVAVSSGTEGSEGASGSSGSPTSSSPTTTTMSTGGVAATTSIPPAPNTAAPSTVASSTAVPGSPSPSTTATTTSTGTAKNVSGRPARPKPSAPPPPKPPVF